MLRLFPALNSAIQLSPGASTNVIALSSPEGCESKPMVNQLSYIKLGTTAKKSVLMLSGLIAPNGCWKNDVVVFRYAGTSELPEIELTKSSAVGVVTYTL